MELTKKQKDELNTSLKDKAREILVEAKKRGVKDNYYFITTFKRYLVQLKILDELEKTIEQENVLVTKEYVKGRGNLYANPAVAEYNRTSDSANKTVNCLMNIINKAPGTDNIKTSETDPLLEALAND